METFHNEHIVQRWIDGGNLLGVHFGWEKEEEEEEAVADLERFVAYCNTLEPAWLSRILKEVTNSPLRKSLKTDLKVDGCYPRLYFKQIDPPYEDNYKKIVSQYGLEPFIVKSNINLKYDIKKNGGARDGKPIFISFIKLGEFYIVNLIGNKTGK